MKLESNLEMYFKWWLEECQEHGLIKGFERSGPFLLADDVFVQTKKGKKKLMQDQIYTPDFKIYVEEDNRFFKDIDKLEDLPVTKPLLYRNGVCYVEVKPTFDSQNMTRLFSINQKTMWSVHNVYINLAKMPKFFGKTFVPERYLITDKNKKNRRINFEYKLLKDLRL